MKPVAFALVSLAFGLSAHADPAFTDGDFGAAPGGSLGGWTTTGTVQTRPIADPINGGTFPSDEPFVFDIALADYFTTGAFAVIGDVSGQIAGAPDTGLHRLARSFTLAPAGAPYDLSIGFRSAFEGRSPFPEDSYCDFFAVRLLGPGGFSQLLLSQVFCVGQSQLNQLAFSANVSDLDAGTYTLEFVLNEGPEFDTLNTAAAVDNVSVEVTGTPYAVPLPAWSPWLLAASLLLAARSRPAVAEATGCPGSGREGPYS